MSSVLEIMQNRAGIEKIGDGICKLLLYKLRRFVSLFEDSQVNGNGIMELTYEVT